MTLVLQPRLVKYRDLDLNFEPHPVTGDVSILTNDVAVERSMKNLIFMNFYEKPFHPEIGCGLRQALFENFTPLMSITIEKIIKSLIENFEPRVTVKQVETKQSDDENTIIVTITYVFLNTIEPRQFTVFMERLR